VVADSVATAAAAARTRSGDKRFVAAPQSRSVARTALTIDHVAFARRDLDDAVAAFEAVGLAPTYGGVHGTGTTHMSLLGFDDGSYLELIAPAPEAEPEDAGFWPRHLAADAGPCGWCIEVDDPRTEAKRLIDAGLSVDGPRSASRETDDGVRVEWDMVFAGADERGTLLPFAIADRTPRDRRVTPTEGVSGGPLSGVAEVVLAVEDLDEAAALFGRAYRFPSPERFEHAGFDAEVARVPGQPVALAAPRTDSSPLVERLDSLGPGPCAHLLGVDETGAEAVRDAYRLGPPDPWGGDRVSWFDEPSLRGQIGVVTRS
jgi:hypothetical protein